MSTPSESTFPARAKALAALVASVLIAALLTFIPSTQADAADLPPSILEGGYIISDAAFFDGDAMSASQIQTFLNGRVSTCTTGYTCLKSYKADIAAKSADKYCKALSEQKSVSAATIINKVAVACGISPKVLLVMLQKEQGLVTSTAPSSTRYGAAMGQSCPDTAACDPRLAGFFNQMYGAARQMQIYTLNPTSFSYKAGQINTINWHPNSSCGTSKVYIQNQATANLYIYTPYRANVAALAAGYGTGDTCSTYGNRNFYNYYVDWFAPDASSSTGAPAQTSACQLPLTADIASRAGTATVKIDKLNVRTAPTLKCTTGITQVSKGDTVSITGAYGAWTRATIGGKTVWIASQYLTLPSTGAPAGGTDSCAQPAASSVTVASGSVVISTSVLNARTAPTTACDTGRIQLSQGDTATRTGEYGVWWRASVSGKTYWVHSDYAAVTGGSTPPVDVCAVPDGVKSAKYTYVVTLPQVKGRTGPSASCDDVKTILYTGDVATANAVSADGEWLRVRVGSDDVWIARRAVERTSSSVPAVDVCAVPDGVKSAKYTYVVTLPQVKGRTGPSASCDDVKTILYTGDVATANAVSADGEWLRVRVGSDDVWIARRAVERTSSSVPAVDVCAVPDGVKSAKYTYVVTLPQVKGRTGPSASCDDVKTILYTGDVATANAVSADGEWLRVRVGSDDVWIARRAVERTSSSVPAVDVCAVPDGVKSAKYTYVVTLPQVKGRTGPSASCDDVKTILYTGDVATANAVSADGEWLRVRVGSDDVWIARRAVERTSSSVPAVDVCAVPDGVKSAKYTYVVTLPQVKGRTGPSASCDDVKTILYTGDVATANAVSADGEWLRVRVGSDDVWIARRAVERTSSSVPAVD
ncbi:SH3 domain-containing protein (plasmid) [Coraliomargarita sp. W4R53]